LRRSGDYQKGDERILGDGAFVDTVLSQAEEHLEQRYRLQAEGYGIDTLIERVGEIVGMSPEELLEPGKERKKVAARSMICYWATAHLGISQMHLAKIFNLTQPAVNQAVRRGKELIESKAYSLFQD
jgi:putative transposase